MPQPPALPQGSHAPSHRSNRPSQPCSVAWTKFIREKQYVTNLSPKTIVDYQCAWKAWCSAMPGTTDQICASTVDDAVVLMRVEKLSPTSVNSYLRVLKVFVRWLGVRTADGDPLPV